MLTAIAALAMAFRATVVHMLLTAYSMTQAVDRMSTLERKETAKPLSNLSREA